MKILIADKMSPSAISDLEALGAEVTFNPDLSADDLPGSIADSEVLIVRSTKVTTDTINAATGLSLIIRAGAGVNTIDLDTASAKGIHVANCPGKNNDAVAELALGHIIAADRRIVFAHSDLQNGEWKKKAYQKAAGLKGRTLGVIGLGAIGSSLVSKGQGIGMEVIAWSRSLTPERAEELKVGYCESPGEVAEKSDVVSLHVAVKPETKHMVNKEFLSKMKDGAILVNCARGEVVDTAALKEAIKEKQLRVGLDVFENEPTGGVAEFEDTELAGMATCTPHIGASTDQAAEAIAAESVRIVKEFMASGKPANVVNVRDKSLAEVNLVVRHYNRVGVLASVLDLLRDVEINIEEMENTIFEGGEAATCTLKLDRKPDDATVAKVQENENIIQAMLT